MASADIYGYEDANPYGYGDASPDGDSAMDTTDYGYGDTTSSTPSSNEDNPYGYGDMDYGDQQSGGEPRRERPRRRCSVTKYSIDEAQSSIQQEFDEHAAVIEQFRNGATNSTAKERCTSWDSTFTGESAMTEDTTMSEPVMASQTTPPQEKMKKKRWGLGRKNR